MERIMAISWKSTSIGVDSRPHLTIKSRSERLGKHDDGGKKEGISKEMNRHRGFTFNYLERFRDREISSPPLAWVWRNDDTRSVKFVEEVGV